MAHDGSQPVGRALACDHGSREGEVLFDIRWVEGGPFGSRREDHVYYTRLEQVLSCDHSVENEKVRVVFGNLVVHADSLEEEGVARVHIQSMSGSRLGEAGAWNWQQDHQDQCIHLFLVDWKVRMWKFRQVRGDRDDSREFVLEYEVFPYPLRDQVNRPWKAGSGNGHVRDRYCRELK